MQNQRCRIFVCLARELKQFDHFCSILLDISHFLSLHLLQIVIIGSSKNGREILIASSGVSVNVGIGTDNAFMLSKTGVNCCWEQNICMWRLFVASPLNNIYMLLERRGFWNQLCMISYSPPNIEGYFMLIYLKILFIRSIIHSNQRSWKTVLIYILSYKPLGSVQNKEFCTSWKLGNMQNRMRRASVWPAANPGLHVNDWFSAQLKVQCFCWSMQ